MKRDQEHDKIGYRRYRRVGVVLFFIMALSMVVISTSIAEQHEEIKFRDFSWGTSFHDVIDYFEDQGLSFRYSNNTFLGWDAQEIIESKWVSIGGTYPDYKTFFVVELGYGSPKLSVAGMDISDMRLFFAYLPDENGDYTRVNADAGLMMGCYVFDVSDVDSSEEAMKQKLTKIYGEVHHVAKDYGIGGKSCTYWYAKDGSFVCLSHLYSQAWGLKKLYVWYGTPESSKWIKQCNQYVLDEAIAEEQNKINNDNNDGL